MGNLYEAINALCKKKGVKGAKMCADIGISKGLLTDLKMGRRSGVSAVTAQKIASYFGVTVAYLLGDETNQGQEDENTVIIRGRDGSYSKKTLTDEQIKMLQAMINSLPEAPDDL